MRYVLIIFSLIPFGVMIYLWFFGGDIFIIKSSVSTLSTTVSNAIPISNSKYYLLSKISAHSAMWILLFAFWIEPLKRFIRFDLIEFKKMLGAFALFYVVLHIVFLAGSYGFDISKLTKLSISNLSYISGVLALIIISLAALIKSWYKIIYIGVVLVITHLLVASGLSKNIEVVSVSMFALALALRLIK